MSHIKRALSEFNKVAKLEEEGPVLQQARDAYSQNPEDEAARNRYSQLSIPAGYPDVHRSAVNFQNALMATAKLGHTRGWQGGENERAELMQAAKTHGVDPGLFVTSEGAGNSKREHVLHLTRLFGGKFLPGDGRSNMWDPVAHSFPDKQAVQGFINSMQQYYPESQLQPQSVPMQGEEQGDDGQPIPTQQMVYNVPFSHEDLGEPFPPGSQAYAMGTAQQRSAAAPYPHFVVVDAQTGEHAVTLEPDPQTQQIVQTFVGGQPVQMQQPGAEEERPEEQPEDQPSEERPEEQPPEQQQAPQEAPQQQPAMAGAVESIDPLERFLAESGFTVGPRSLQENESARWKVAHDVLEAHKSKTFKSSKKRKGRQPWWKHEALAGLFDNPRRELKDKNARDLRRLAGLQTNDVEHDMSDELNEMLNLFRNSTRTSPSLKMENLPVDSNRGVSSRGNSHFDKFASPATREKVLKSRMDEIEAFARSRSIPMSNMYAATEVSMRTGKVPNMTQYGLNGDDAVAAKQFILSNILNIQGLEDVSLGGDALNEASLSWDRDADRPELTKRGTQAHRDFQKQLEKDPSREARVQRGIQRRQEVERAQKQAARPAEFVAHDKAMSRYKLASQINPATRKPLPPKGYQPMSMDYDGDPIEETHGTSGKHPAVAGTKGNPPQASPGQRFMKGPLSKKAYKGRFYVEEGAKGKPQHGFTAKKVRKFSGADLGSRSNEMPMTKEADARRERKLKITRDRKPISLQNRTKASRWMAEERPIRKAEGPTSTGHEQNPGPSAPVDVSRWEKRVLLPKKVISQLRKEIGDRVDGYPQEELYRLARERGLLGTEESVELESVHTRGEPGLGGPPHRDGEYVGPKLAFSKKGGRAKVKDPTAYEVRAAKRADRRAAKKDTANRSLEDVDTTNALLGIAEGDPRGEAWPKLDSELARLLRPSNGKTLAGADLGEDDYSCTAKTNRGKFLGYSQLHQAMYEFPTEEAANAFASKMSDKTTATPTVNGKRVSIDEPALGENVGHLGAGGTSTTRGSASPHHGGIGPSTSPILKKGRSKTDKILGIEEGDPRGESWPKLSAEMQKLLRLEDIRSLAPKPGFNMPEPEVTIDEATTGGAGVGAFIGAGMQGFNLAQRTPSRPSYDDSETLDGDEDNNRKAWARMMQKHGVRQEGFYGDTEADKARRAKMGQKVKSAGGEEAREPSPLPKGQPKIRSAVRDVLRPPAAGPGAPVLRPGQPLERRTAPDTGKFKVRRPAYNPRDSRGYFGAQFMKKKM